MTKRANDNLTEGVAYSLKYLRSGGLGEVIGFADLARTMGDQKVQMDTDMAIALCILATTAIQMETNHD